MAEDTQQLEALRDKVLGDVSGMADQLTDDSQIGFDGLLAIARNTGNATFLEKAYQKVSDIQDPQAKIEAYMDVLGEIELQLAARNAPLPDDVEDPEEEEGSEDRSQDDSQGHDQQ